jgi:hypothetical protein
MPKQKRPTGKGTKTGFVLGHAAFAKISAVEGIRLKPAMKRRAAEAASAGLSAEEYRKTIIRAHRKDVREQPEPKPGDNPFAVFSEWASEADEKVYGTL